MFQAIANIEVEHYNQAVPQIAQMAMRDVVGGTELDRLLTKQDEISKRIQGIVDEATGSPGGLRQQLLNQNILNYQKKMKRTIAK